MTMGAIPQDEKAWQAVLVEAVYAGADMLLVCRHLERFRLAHEALTREAQASSTFARRLHEAANRVISLRKTLPHSL
jgi:beta-N-acetylhexosaminidase